MAYFAEEFVGKYSLSKTMKFGLVPVGETKKYLEEKDCPLLSGDYRRSKAYPVVKELLDKYYRFVIEKVFEDASISEEGVLAAYKAYADSDFKALEDCCTKLRVEVASYFGAEHTVSASIRSCFALSRSCRCLPVKRARLNLAHRY